MLVEDGENLDALVKTTVGRESAEIGITPLLVSRVVLLTKLCAVGST